MTIQEIKSRINILELAFHLGIKVDPKTKKALCPFHDDKNPSLQFSEKKQIVTCFSSRCDAGTMDVIKLTEKYLKKSTAEAIQYLKEYLGEPKKEIPNYAEMLKDMQRSYRASKLGREYAKSRNVQNEELGYNKWKDGKYHELRGCITFGLKDEFGKVVSLYGRSILEGNNKHFYTKNRRGL
ncbi:MAG: hypothetical protein GY810_24405, partial [Aureispira sp.]|nr:hypothetical protein [Aureispira sp.]